MRADADAATSVVLLRAEGRSFCAGYDIGGQGGFDSGRRLRHARQRPPPRTSLMTTSSTIAPTRALITALTIPGPK
jgi:enoyl-CoA hydratase/carnithine racemase